MYALILVRIPIFSLLPIAKHVKNVYARNSKQNVSNAQRSSLRA